MQHLSAAFGAFPCAAQAGTALLPLKLSVVALRLVLLVVISLFSAIYLHRCHHD